ncbi:cyclin-dependent kinase 2-interacting protein [Synchiropus splendidus]|uniref:cyclin-dependent kinase 2-interacting protein n=1 Tax=Synchiropus splendidus TaxID=270530 RepID=UPI00237D7F6F|nr:cyclin-dependent kinase 2-interacting protein [Synchiropus splendidus]XP_053700520.1 cyclin-dependent kinase 2-interacting protein [Synchiropus splendidus]
MEGWSPAARKSSAVTGSARKLRDTAADWHNLILRWEKLNDEGLTVATSVVNLRRSSFQAEQRQQVDETPPPSSWPRGETVTLEEECLKLQDIVNKMASVVAKMQRLVTTLRGIMDLEAFQFGPEGRKVPLFHSWSTQTFEEASVFLLDAFTQELQLKQTILQELAHTDSPDLGLVYVSCWLHQPYVPPQSRLKLEAMLLETGHRTL